MFREKSVPVAKGSLKNSAKPWPGRTLGENEEEEDLADSGRLFVRNLPYTSTEEDLEQLFSTFGRGPVSSSLCARGTEREQTARVQVPSTSRRLPTAGRWLHPSSLCSSVDGASDPRAGVSIPLSPTWGLAGLPGTGGITGMVCHRNPPAPALTEPRTDQLWKRFPALALAVRTLAAQRLKSSHWWCGCDLAPWSELC